jgi:hypothetical protein
MPPPRNRGVLGLTYIGKEGVPKLSQYRLNSICSHIFYGASMGQCTRCGGLCLLVSDSDMQAMARYAVRNLEEDVLA